MKWFIRQLQSCFIALISIIYLPFLNKSKKKLIQSDFKRLCSWKKFRSHCIISFCALLNLKSSEALYIIGWVIADFSPLGYYRGEKVCIYVRKTLVRGLLFSMVFQP